MRRITRKYVADHKIFEENPVYSDHSDASADKNDTLTSNGNGTEVSTTPNNTTITRYGIPYPTKNISCISFGSSTPHLSLIFTQGAGGDIESSAVTNFAEGFAELKNILCFQGRSNLEARTKMFRTVMEHHPCDVIGGRSMGARTAIATAREIDSVKALVLVSYPLVGANGDVRDQLLLDIDEGVDVLFVIGDRDSMCDLDRLKLLMKRMKAKTWLVVVHTANHGMEMRPLKATKAVGRTVGKVVARWIEEHDNSLINYEIRWDEETNDVIVAPWNL